MSSNTEKNFSNGFLILAIVLFAFMFGNICYIMFSGRDENKTYEDPQMAKTVIRGTITDRYGNILAIETPVYDLAFLLKQIPDLAFASDVVAPYIGQTRDQIIMQSGNFSTYAMIKRHVPEDNVEDLRTAINDAGLQKSVLLEKRAGRVYPASFHAAHLIGFVNTESQGLEGLEYQCDDILSPYPRLNEDITYGDDITLTLDLDIQYLLDVQVQKIIEEHNPDYCMAIILDAKTGEILATTSYPWYNPAYYQYTNEEAKLNRTTTYTYEPGSVMKVFTLASALEHGIDTTKPFFCDGSVTFNVQGQSFTINCHQPHGEVTGREMITKSCNGAIASWSLMQSNDEFYTFLRSLGFGTRPEIDFPGLSAGILSKPDTWSNRTKATIGFGQEISVTALQMATAATALANKGVLKPPVIIKKMTDENGISRTLPEKKGVRVMKEETAEQILSYMESATQKGGTATAAAVKGIRVSAKTGTAEIINPISKSYVDGTSLASTLAIVPTEEPKYIIYFAASAPKGDSVWGASVAAPSCGAIISGLASQGKLATKQQNTVTITP